MFARSQIITDFRKVNAVTVGDSYPLPRMEDCVVSNQVIKN